MPVLWRINLWVTLFFALVALLGSALLLRQGSADVQREMRAAAYACWTNCSRGWHR